MRRKTILILITVAIILLSIFCAVAFYSIPFSKANTLLIAANKSEIPNKFDDEAYISEENYKKLCVIDRTLDENEYVQLKTDKQYRFVNLKNVNLIYSVKATIDSFDEIKTTDSFEKRMIISFSYINHKWFVTNVNIVND